MTSSAKKAHFFFLISYKQRPFIGRHLPHRPSQSQINWCFLQAFLVCLLDLCTRQKCTFTLSNSVTNITLQQNSAGRLFSDFLVCSFSVHVHTMSFIIYLTLLSVEPGFCRINCRITKPSS